MKNRTKIDIVAQILTSATGGETRTKIMYKSFLSHGQAKGYLEMLLQGGLLDRPSAHRYQTTDKGLRFIDAYDHLGEFMLQEIIVEY